MRHCYQKERRTFWLEGDVFLSGAGNEVAQFAFETEIEFCEFEADGGGVGDFFGLGEANNGACANEGTTRNLEGQYHEIVFAKGELRDDTHAAFADLQRATDGVVALIKDTHTGFEFTSRHSPTICGRNVRHSFFSAEFNKF